MLIVTDVLYENYKLKKEEMKRKMASGGKEVTTHFSVNEDEESLFEIFDDGEDGDFRKE